MTSTPVTDVKAYFMNVTSSGTGNTADRTADFGKVMGDELIAQNVARYPAKGAELGQSQS